MVGDDDSDILVLELRDNILDVFDGNGVDAGERLVEKDELRVDGEGAGDFAAAPLSSGELDAEALAHLREIEFVDEGLQALFPLLAGHSRHLHHGHDVVLDGHFAEDGSFLGKIADTLLRTLEHRKSGDLLVVKVNPAGVRDYLSGDHIETRGLAGSVRAEETDYFTLFHFHGDAFDDSPDAVFLDEILATKLHILNLLF